MAEKIAFSNFKGGVGKTTTAVSFGGYVTRTYGKKTLLIDLDSEGQGLTTTFNIDTKDRPTITEVLLGKEKIEDALVEVSGMTIIPANDDLATVENMIKRIQDPLEAVEVLNEKFKNLNTFDYVLLDCPPALSQLALNAMFYAQRVIIPVYPEVLAIKPARRMVKKIEDLSKYKPIEFMGFIFCRYEKSAKLSMDVFNLFKQLYGDDKVFKTIIRRNTSLASAPGWGKDIFSYMPNSIGARDYASFAEEVLNYGK